MNFSDDDLYQMLLIRSFEKTVLQLFSQGKIKGTSHTCLGQEYIPVALKPLLSSDDFIISNHRGHGHFLTFSGKIEGLFSELMGHSDGICGGYGGSQHLKDGNIMTTGIQGEGVCIALGIAWSFLQKKQKNLAVVFVGDGTFGRGTVYESLNIASLFDLPYVMIVENNGIAMTTRISENMAGTIKERVQAFRVDYLCVRSQNPSEIRKEIAPHLQRVRTNARPLVIEFLTYRTGPHSKGDDTRTQEELAEVNRKTWYTLCEQSDKDQLQRLEAMANREIENILRRAMEGK